MTRSLVIGVMGAIAFGASLLITACSDNGTESDPQADAATGSSASVTSVASGAQASVAAPESFAICESCHAVQEGADHGIGPNLHSVFGTAAGSKSGFEYSEVMAASGVIWDEESLNAYLQSPQEFLPGNRMAFLGEADAQARGEIIDFLKTLN